MTNNLQANYLANNGLNKTSMSNHDKAYGNIINRRHNTDLVKDALDGLKTAALIENIYTTTKLLSNNASILQ